MFPGWLLWAIVLGACRKKRDRSIKLPHTDKNSLFEKKSAAAHFRYIILKQMGHYSCCVPTLSIRDPLLMYHGEVCPVTRYMVDMLDSFPYAVGIRGSLLGVVNIRKIVFVPENQGIWAT